MADSKAYMPIELAGHRIGITRPGPDYLVTVTDMETGLVISNVTRFLLVWDGTTLQASVFLDGSSVQVPVHHVFTVTDSPVEEEPEQDIQHTPTSVPSVPVSSPAPEVVSEPSTSSEAATGVPPVEEEEAHNGDTEPELPVVEPQVAPEGEV